VEGPFRRGKYVWGGCFRMGKRVGSENSQRQRGIERSFLVLGVGDHTFLGGDHNFFPGKDALGKGGKVPGRENTHWREGGEIS